MLKSAIGMLSPSVRTIERQTPRLRGRRGVERRANWLRDNPLCVMCRAEGRTGVAVEVDHIVPLADGGADHEDNLQGLCAQHHREKTAAEARERGRAE